MDLWMKVARQVEIIKCDCSVFKYILYNNNNNNKNNNNNNNNNNTWTRMAGKVAD